MGEQKVDIAATTPLPSREAISEALLADEEVLVDALIAQARFTDDEDRRIEAVATRLVCAVASLTRDRWPA